MTLDQAKALADFLDRQPWPGFLALTLGALGVLFVLYVREKNAHQKTLREILPLVTTFSTQWNRHQDLEEAMVSRLAPPQVAAPPPLALVEPPAVVKS